MARELKGSLQGHGLRIAVAVSRFNEFITQRLLDGAREGLLRHGVREEDITIAWTPGSFELPLVGKSLAKSGLHDAVVCLGCVIRGETAHFEYVAGEAARGIAQASLETGVPLIFGVLATDTLEQAMERAGGKLGNRGYDAAVAAIETANLLQRVRGQE
ncbi:MAG: 6,7-dimethyl-8-ribityllumazine synthase [Dehalococcoidia bacterium]